ncbi:hypothetical protein RD792_012870 [Penstemon davidsonii]|uniref:Uncharacterized protein n=1 Tax=Penstemon davidsonii TaxID=160366 RepID=A0ABR0CY34_9LAMI|nr:hypothetical protein RD792_012870 [Penstemon davidsonii]
MDQSTNFAPELVTENSIINKKKKKINCNNTKRYALLSFNELPDYMKDNEYILNYYRANWPLKEAFFSVFRWHNETLNVWTHLLGFMLFLGLTVANLVNVPQLADFITIFTGQFPSTAEANVSNNFSLGSSKLIDLKQESNLKTDITSPDFATTNWPFYCTPHWQIVYLSGISIMGICTIITLLSPALSTAKYRSFRALLFVSMGLFGLIPAIHALVVNWDDPHRNITLAYESIMALSYLIGTLFYVSRVPERWMPGWFDLAGHSHQIFHVFVVMGAMAHYGAAQIFLRYRMAC